MFYVSNFLSKPLEIPSPLAFSSSLKNSLLSFFFAKSLSRLQWYPYPEQVWHTGLLWLLELACGINKPTVKDQCWEMADKLHWMPKLPSRARWRGHHNYLTLFDDHPEADGILINSPTILRMRVEKGEKSWYNLRFASKTNPDQPTVRCLMREGDGLQGWARCFTRME